MNNFLLMMSLQVAVPLEIARLQERGGRAGITDWQLERMWAYGEQLGSEGDTILYKVKHKTAENFARLVEVLAIMAFFLGGVTFAGFHFEVRDDPSPHSSFDEHDERWETWRAALDRLEQEGKRAV